VKPGDLREQLGAVRARLADDAARRAHEAALKAAAQARDRAEREQFTRAVGPVQRVPDAQRASTAPTPPEPWPRQREADEAQALASSLSDELDPTTLLDTDDGLAFRRPGIGADVLARLRRGQWTLQRQIDLHGLTREAAREALARFIRQAARDGLRCVRVVHGKGNGSPGREGVLKAKVRTWLVQKNEVIAFAPARPGDGGNGALIVLLDRR
jgi:DNA-nicking Smr family endonuclease